MISTRRNSFRVLMNETSETGPTQGTLRVFPDVGLSNAYIILRPFFHPLVDVKSPEIYDVKNWSFGACLL